MNYEEVYLKEKIVAGTRIRTNNNDPNMVNNISKVWNNFFQNGIYQSILNKKNNNTIGLYTNYENGVNGDYDLMVCCEISDEKNLPKGMDLIKIEEGKYAKFVVRGKQEKAVAECWSKIWAMNLDRKYSFDFEEYKGNCQSDNSEISIYIAIN